ncbi:MAG TPA: hypothetical protein VG448_02130 [Solirubrobacterales bacterium]|nr:hypothetical protein [Solirubrobacterales bacterium]
MTQLASKSQKSNGFALKEQQVDLIRPGDGISTTMTVADLEMLRVQSPSVPASKHGLEIICGASCETGAI